MYINEIILSPNITSDESMEGERNSGLEEDFFEEVVTLEISTMSIN